MRRRVSGSDTERVEPLLASYRVAKRCGAVMAVVLLLSAGTLIVWPPLIVRVGATGTFRAPVVLDGSMRSAGLVDTGSTSLVLCADTGALLGLERGEAVGLLTSNGMVYGYRTRVHSMKIGHIVIHDVVAVIHPESSCDEVLVGMSALKKLVFVGMGGRLILIGGDNVLR